jgi:hypothetical protein
MGYGRWGWRARSILIHAGETACGCDKFPVSCSLIGTWYRPGIVAADPF